MPKSKNPERSIVDAILNTKMKGFRLRAEAGALPLDARLTQRAVDIFKKNLLGGAPVHDGTTRRPAKKPAPGTRAVVLQKSKKKVLQRQG